MEAPLLVKVLQSFQKVLTSAVCSLLKNVCFAFLSSEFIRFLAALYSLIQRENGWVTSALKFFEQRVTFSYSPQNSWGDPRDLRERIFLGAIMLRNVSCQLVQLRSVSQSASESNSHALLKSPSEQHQMGTAGLLLILYLTKIPIWSELARGGMEMTLTGHETKTRSMMDGTP